MFFVVMTPYTAPDLLYNAKRDGKFNILTVRVPIIIEKQLNRSYYFKINFN